MMEIILIVILFKKLKAISDKKNRSKWLPWILPLFWIVGEFITPFVIAVIYAIIGRPINNFLYYGYALLGAAIGAIIAFGIVRRLPTKPFTCLNCNNEFENKAKFGARCDACNTQFKIVNGKLALLENNA